MILATPEQLDEKVQAMKWRIKELEEALQEAQALTSPDCHPLLQQIVKQETPEALVPDEPPPDAVEGKGFLVGEPAPMDNLARTFGTLTLTPERGMKVSTSICAITAKIYQTSGMA